MPLTTNQLCMRRKAAYDFAGYEKIPQDAARHSFASYWLPVNNSNFCTTNFGNLGRNVFRGPAQQNWDFSLIKNFKITERQQLRFTTDFFNIWNHANFANPTVTDVETIFCSPGVNGCPANGINPATPFGKITGTLGTPRLIQFSVRYAF